MIHESERISKTELSSSWEFNLQMTIPKRHYFFSWHLHSYSTSTSLAHTCPLQASSCWISNPKLARNVRKKHQISQIAAFLSTACCQNFGGSETSTKTRRKISWRFEWVVQKCPTSWIQKLRNPTQEGTTPAILVVIKGICLLTIIRHLKKECSC